MKEFFIYEGKVALLLVAFYLLFKVLLSRETFHRLNRVILLGTSFLAFVLPFCVITYTREVSAAEASRMLTNISIEAMPQEILLDGPTIWPWVMLVWSLGALAVLLNHLWSMLSIARLLRSSNSISGDRRAKIHILDKELTPFSWMGHIVLSRKDFEENGSIICREILKNPPSDPKPTPRTEEFYKQRPCARLVVLACEILDEYIKSHPIDR